MFRLMLVYITLVRFRLLSGHLFGKSCSLGCPYVLFVFRLFIILVISRFCFEGWIWVLKFSPVPGHFLLVTFVPRWLTRLKILHYENTPMQYTAIFHGCKNDNFQFNFFDFFICLLKTYIVGTR